MRLWHYKLIPYLPNQQLLAQWRELNSIYKNQPNHILINYVYDYDKIHLLKYSDIIIEEMRRRNYKVNLENYYEYFYKVNLENFTINDYEELRYNNTEVFCLHHDFEYLEICCYNLYEKYIRGQKGFNEESIKFIERIINKEI